MGKVEDMVKLTIYYINMVQCKQPSRKIDIIKIAMDKQSKYFPMVIKKVEKELRKIFGFQLIGLKSGPDEELVACEILEATSYITTNIYRGRVAVSVTTNQTLSTDLLNAVLLLILSNAYMLERHLEEDEIWKILEDLEFVKHLPFCKGRDDFKRFLKREYVDLLYLKKYETKDERSDVDVVTYGWGIRAELEYSKYGILKFVAQSLGKKPEEFVDHFSKISHEEIVSIDEEDERFRSKQAERVEATNDEANCPSFNQLVNETSESFAAFKIPAAVEGCSKTLYREKAETSDEEETT